MRILQVCSEYPPSLGGAGQYVKALSERLAADHAVSVFACDLTGKFPQREEVNGVSVRRFKSFSPSRAYHLSLKMAQELSHASYDIVHGHNYHALPFYFARRARRQKLVVSPHYHGRGATPFRDLMLKFYRPAGRRILAEADRIIAVSEYERDLIMGDFKSEAEGKIAVVSPGVTLSDFAAVSGIARDIKSVLYVGRLERYKGVSAVIRALSLLEGFRLDIVGRGDYQKDLVELTRGLGLAGRVSFYSDLDRMELVRMYARAGLFVMLSRNEAYSMAVAEALAAKTPCLVAKSSALNEWIDGRNCFGVDWDMSPELLAESIRDHSGVTVGHIARLRDWDSVAENVLELYQE